MKKTYIHLTQTSIKMAFLGFISMFLLNSCTKETEEDVANELKKYGYIENSKTTKSSNIQINSIREFQKIKESDPFQKGKIYSVTFDKNRLKIADNQDTQEEGTEWDCFFMFKGFGGIQIGSPSSFINFSFNAYGAGNSFTGANMSLTGVLSFWYGVNLWSTSATTYSGYPAINLYFNSFWNVNAGSSSSGVLSEPHHVVIYKTGMNGQCYLQVLY